MINNIFAYQQPVINNSYAPEEVIKILRGECNLLD